MLHVDYFWSGARIHISPSAVAICIKHTPFIFTAAVYSVNVIHNCLRSLQEGLYYSQAKTPVTMWKLSSWFNQEGYLIIEKKYLNPVVQF